jgi:hypothetical protein
MFFVRLLLGLRCLWSIVKTGNIDVALRDQLGLVRISTDPDVNEDRGPVPASEERVSGALQVLRILQEGSGLIDFLTEDLNQYSDQQLAHGVRGMQPQARDVLLRVLRLDPVVAKAEGELQDLPEEPAKCLADGSLRLEGRPLDFEAINEGRLLHRGWRASEVRLMTPPLAQNPTILHPAVYEIE